MPPINDHSAPLGNGTPHRGGDSLLIEAPPAPSLQAPAPPGPADHLRIGVQVLRDLLRVEDRPNRVRRVLRIWESKVAAAIRNRDVEAAEAWMRAVTADPTIPPEHTGAVASATATLSRPALIDDLLVWIVDADAMARAAGLLAEWGPPVVERMIELMAVDDPPVSRRHIVDVLTTIARSDSRLVSAHAGDHRWFIVRNVAIALGRSGRLATIPTLRHLSKHEDPRVRVEAIRGLSTIDAAAALPDLLVAFTDGDRRVRQAAVSLLRACPSPEVVTRLADLVVSGRLAATEAERLVEVIGERRDPAVLPALESIAARRGRRGVPKTVRLAARHQLARRVP